MNPVFWLNSLYELNERDESNNAKSDHFDESNRIKSDNNEWLKNYIY